MVGMAEQGQDMMGENEDQETKPNLIDTGCDVQQNTQHIVLNA